VCIICRQRIEPHRARANYRQLSVCVAMCFKYRPQRLLPDQAYTVCVRRRNRGWKVGNEHTLGGFRFSSFFFFLPSQSPAIICPTSVAQTLFLFQFPQYLNPKVFHLGPQLMKSWSASIWSHVSSLTKNLTAKVGGDQICLVPGSPKLEGTRLFMRAARYGRFCVRQRREVHRR